MLTLKITFQQNIVYDQNHLIFQYVSPKKNDNHIHIFHSKYIQIIHIIYFFGALTFWNAKSKNSK